jgi:hypothetical protein
MDTEERSSGSVGWACWDGRTHHDELEAFNILFPSRYPKQKIVSEQYDRQMDSIRSKVLNGCFLLKFLYYPMINLELNFKIFKMSS